MDVSFRVLMFGEQLIMSATRLESRYDPALDNDEYGGMSYMNMWEMRSLKKSLENARPPRVGTANGGLR